MDHGSPAPTVYNTWLNTHTQTHRIPTMSRKVKEHILFTIRSFHDIAEWNAESDLCWDFKPLSLKNITDELETELEIYLKIFVMLYADDTILLAESAEDLQVQLNAFVEYCDNWKMKVNVNKTKIMVFGFGKLRHKSQIHLWKRWYRNSQTI